MKQHGIPRYVGWLLYTAARVWLLTAAAAGLGGAVDDARGWLVAVCVLCAAGCWLLAWILMAYTPQHARGRKPHK